MKQPTLQTSLANWPVGSRIILVDAWMRNPIEVKITRHWNAEHIGAEDSAGIVYYAHIGRIKSRVADEFDDIFQLKQTVDDFADVFG